MELDGAFQKLRTFPIKKTRDPEKYERNASLALMFYFGCFEIQY